jgi:thioesterase domain-containing protein
MSDSDSSDDDEIVISSVLAVQNAMLVSQNAKLVAQVVMLDDPMAAQPSAKKKMKIDTRRKNGTDDKSKGRKFSLEAFESHHIQPIAASIAETSQKLADSNKRKVESKKKCRITKAYQVLARDWSRRGCRRTEASTTTKIARIE